MRNKTIGCINKYDRCLVLLSGALCFGLIGGALQVVRVLAILFVPYLVTIIRREGLGYARSIRKVLVLLYLFMLLSFIWSPDKQEALKELAYYIIHFFLFLECLVIARFARVPLKSISVGWLWAVVLCLIIALWEIATGNHLSVAAEQGGLYNTGTEVLNHMTASVTFGNYNSFVTFLCYSFPWLFYISQEKGCSIKIKAISMAAIILAALVVVINASRGGVIAIVIMFATYFLMSKKSSLKFLIISTIFLGITYFLYQYGDILMAVFLARASDGGLLSDEEGRGAIWAYSMRAFFDTWGIGSGIGGLNEALKKYANGGITVTHNLFLEILVQYGIVVFFFVIKYLWKLFHVSIKLKGNRKTVLMMTFVSMPVYTIIDSTYLLNPMFWIHMATIYIFIYYERIKYFDNHLRQTAPI